MPIPDSYPRCARVLSLVLFALLSSITEAKESGLTAQKLFTVTNVWSVHLKFTAEEWAAIEPKGGGGFGGGARSAFGPGNMLASTFLEKGDANNDGALSSNEFSKLGGTWFKDWDKAKSGKLNANDIRAGLNSSFGGKGMIPGLNLQGAQGKRNGLASATGLEFQYVHADLEFDGRLLKDVGVRYKGNGTFMQSRSSKKRSFKISLDHFVKDQDLGPVTKLNLHNNVTDGSWMNEPLSHKLFRDAGVPAARSSYARVYVTVPGKYEKEYFGLYSIVENIDKDFAKEQFGTKKGAIFKPVTRAPFEYLGEDWKKYNQTYDPKTDLSEAQKRRVIDFCKLVSKANDQEFNGRLGEFLDIDEFARFMAVTTWLSTIDSILGPGQNYLVYLHPKTDKFNFIAWDLDHSFGQFGMVGSQDQRENLSITRPWQGENHFLERIFKSESFKKPYLARMQEFSNTLFIPDRFVRQVDEVAAALRPAVKEESQSKLDRFDKLTKGESIAFEAPGIPGGAAGNVKGIKAFVTARAGFVRAQLAGKSEGEPLMGGILGGRGPGGPPGPGMFMGGPVLKALDQNADGEVTQEEFSKTFAKWFKEWNSDQSGSLTEEQLRAGMNRDLSPFGRGGPGPFRAPEPPK